MKVMERNSKEAVRCPFCSQSISVKRRKNRVCQHTMVVSNDKGVEFENRNFSMTSLQQESQLNDDGRGFEPNIVMIKTYEPAPSFFGAYYLFKK